MAIPTVDQEAARDLVRAREDCRGDLMRARHRLSKLLLRHGIVYYGGAAWTGKHDVWLRHEALPQLTTPATRLTFDSDYETVLGGQGPPGPARRRDRADGRRLRVHRGGAPAGVSAWGQHPDRVRPRGRDRRLAPVHRRTPSARSSGSSPANTPRVLHGSQGSITKTGNGHARRLLVEAAWHHRARYLVGKTMRDRWDLAPAAARVRGDEGNRRLHQRWVRFIERRKRHTVANVAIARELAGWCWSLAVMDGLTPRAASPPTAAGGSARSDPRRTYEQPRPRRHARP